MKREDGFTLIELMITMIMFIIVIASVSSIFLGLVNQFKQQSKIAETNLEGLTGLEILRQDIEQAGYGLPWNVTGVTDTDGDGNLWDELPNYLEAAGAASAYNDAPQNAPRAIFSDNDNALGLGLSLNNSDYLVIKSINVARNDNCKKWTTLSTTGTRTWNPDRENVNKNDNGTPNNNVRVITLFPGSNETNSQSLISNSAAFSTTFPSVTAAPWQPTDTTETRLVYGVDPGANLRMPFNRADYFIEVEPNIDVPDRCAPNLGVLVKAVARHNDGGFDLMPLLDCVADMQVVYGMDTDAAPDGITNCYVNNLADVLATVDAANIRQRVREVRVYILTHEGQFDQNFNRPVASSSIRVGEASSDLTGGSCTGVSVLGRDFDLSGITNYQNYRWKVYTIVVNPNNLR